MTTKLDLDADRVSVISIARAHRLPRSRDQTPGTIADHRHDCKTGLLGPIRSKTPSFLQVNRFKSQIDFTLWVTIASL